jgi:hypothetical protein
MDSDLDLLCNKMEFSTIIKDRNATDEYAYLVKMALEAHRYLINNIDPTVEYINDVNELFKGYKKYFPNIVRTSRRFEARMKYILELIDEHFKSLSMLTVYQIFCHVYLLVQDDHSYDSINDSYDITINSPVCFDIN